MLTRGGSSGYVESIEHAFSGPPDGADPANFDTLALDDAGNLYGTTSEGGDVSCNCGVVFKLTSSGSGYAETILLTFDRTNGASPETGLVVVKHALFGTALGGRGVSGHGIVFELAAANGGYRETIIHQFSGNRDGSDPAGALTLGKGGILFGTTSGGGLNARGTVFKLVPSGAGYDERVIYDFPSLSGGAYPIGALTLDAATGTVYGTAAMGGAGNVGTAFSLTPHGGQYTARVLHAFTGGSDGATPLGNLILNGSSLYGVAEQGGGRGGLGVVYRLSPAGSGYAETTLHEFSARDLRGGQLPESGLVMDQGGDLFGTTIAGGMGPSGGYGVAFELVPSGARYTERILHAFGSGTDGGAPSGGLVAGKDGTLYGTTAFGGGSFDGGTVFQLRAR
jgi:uncharacterized repeat protein (TIGR03803 family)